MNPTLRSETEELQKRTEKEQNDKNCGVRSTKYIFLKDISKRNQLLMRFNDLELDENVSWIFAIFTLLVTLTGQFHWDHGTKS